MKHAIAAVLICAALPFAVQAKADATDKQVLPTAPCEYEDSNFCIWDGKHMGNGSGASLMVFADGTYIRITHHWAHKRLNKG